MREGRYYAVWQICNGPGGLAPAKLTAALDVGQAAAVLEALTALGDGRTYGLARYDPGRAGAQDDPARVPWELAAWLALSDGHRGICCAAWGWDSQEVPLRHGGFVERLRAWEMAQQ